MKRKHILMSMIPALAFLSCSTLAIAAPTDLRDVIAVALESNPEINLAAMNKEAIEFEREQAKGLYLPRISLELSAGIRRLENATRRNLGIANRELYPLEAVVRVEQTLIDFGRRRGEVLRQSARVDGAALRVAERSEFIALQVARQYLDILLQQRIVAAATDNLAFHNSLANDLRQGVEARSISLADSQQADERVRAARIRLTQADEALINAKISLLQLSGLHVKDVQMPDMMTAKIAPNLLAAIGLARTKHPKIREAMADVDAANALVEKEHGDLFPTVGLELTGRYGHDIDAFHGETNDLQGRVMMRWDIFDGGINRAKYQEMIRRASESRFRLHQITREAESDVRHAWNSRQTQTALERDLHEQSNITDALLVSYQEQFRVGRRSLLDVLDAQNTRFNTHVRAETAYFSKIFAGYQILTATNAMLDAFGLAPPEAGESYAREADGYGPPVPAELQYRRKPS